MRLSDFWHEGSVFASLRSSLNQGPLDLERPSVSDFRIRPDHLISYWRRIEVVITRRTRNAFVGLNRHEGSNPSVSVYRNTDIERCLYFFCIIKLEKHLFNFMNRCYIFRLFFYNTHLIYLRFKYYLFLSIFLNILFKLFNRCSSS